MTDIQIGSMWEPNQVICSGCRTEQKHKVLDVFPGTVYAECVGCGYDVKIDKSFFLWYFQPPKVSVPQPRMAPRCTCESTTLFNRGCQCGAFAKEYKAKYGKDPR